MHFNIPLDYFWQILLIPINYFDQQNGRRKPCSYHNNVQSFQRNDEPVTERQILGGGEKEEIARYEQFLLFHQFGEGL